MHDKYSYGELLRGHKLIMDEVVIKINTLLYIYVYKKKLASHFS